ncbi:MAG TPA: hypothetical protein VKP65_24780, partial [Rhodothermales bacterium]|nr:hypothetical protein [Rhodothermales bacterium]
DWVSSLSGEMNFIVGGGLIEGVPLESTTAWLEYELQNTTKFTRSCLDGTCREAHWKKPGREKQMPLG